CLFSLLMTVASATIFLLSSASKERLGVHPWPIYSRYFLGPELVALFGWPILLSQPPLAGVRPRMVLQALPLVALGGLLTVTMCEKRSPTGPPYDDYPPTVRAVDDACARLGLTDGVGDYDAAKHITLLSRRGVRVRQVHFDRNAPCGFRAFHWL